MLVPGSTADPGRPVLTAPPQGRPGGLTGLLSSKGALHAVLSPKGPRFRPASVAGQSVHLWLHDEHVDGPEGFWWFPLGAGSEISSSDVILVNQNLKFPNSPFLKLLPLCLAKIP